MKKILITSAAMLVTVAAFAQGTVTFNNGGLNKISTGTQGTASSTWVATPTTAGLFNYGGFYGIGQSTSLAFISGVLGVNSTATTGVIAASTGGAMTGYQIPGTASGQTDVWFQIKGWSASYGLDWVAAQQGAATGNGYFGETAIVNVPALGPSTGPGAAIWQTATGTDLHKFAGGFAMMTGVIPEPTSMALAGLGLASLLIFRRRK